MCFGEKFNFFLNYFVCCFLNMSFTQTNSDKIMCDVAAVGIGDTFSDIITFLKQN